MLMRCHLAFVDVRTGSGTRAFTSVKKITHYLNIMLMRVTNATVDGAVRQRSACRCRETNTGITEPANYCPSKMSQKKLNQVHQFLHQTVQQTITSTASNRISPQQWVQDFRISICTTQRFFTACQRAAWSVPARKRLEVPVIRINRQV